MALGVTADTKLKDFTPDVDDLDAESEASTNSNVDSDDDVLARKKKPQHAAKKTPQVTEGSKTAGKEKKENKSSGVSPAMAIKNKKAKRVGEGEGKADSEGGEVAAPEPGGSKHLWIIETHQCTIDCSCAYTINHPHAYTIDRPHAYTINCPCAYPVVARLCKHRYTVIRTRQRTLDRPHADTAIWLHQHGAIGPGTPTYLSSGILVAVSDPGMPLLSWVPSTNPPPPSLLP
ncbi:hypothetical protein B0H17DRAFT_1209704 [Mycena rosella]|uniref:Uncharacterized protein n=1 Tax=Mycena rosella TaxID=1033263 RepID=A0AAD7CXW9_MYCRO|nr:hypothetical protein B0H17DRAFT_1209704 [Mycena rosella]